MADPGAPVDFNMPLPEVPFTGPDGRITRPWLFAVLGLWARTGGTPAVPTPVVMDAVSALAVEVAMEDVAFPSPPPAFASLMADAMAETAPPVHVAFPILLGEAFADPPPSPPINPLLAALLVSDIS